MILTHKHRRCFPMCISPDQFEFSLNGMIHSHRVTLHCWQLTNVETRVQVCIAFRKLLP